jgi:hypothetical protein
MASPGSFGLRVASSTGPAGSPRVMRSAAIVHASSSERSPARSTAVTSNAATVAWRGAGSMIPA